MPGKLSAQRAHADARRAAMMAADGMTHRQIAEALLLQPAQIKARILLGQRLIAADISLSTKATEKARKERR